MGRRPRDREQRGWDEYAAIVDALVADGFLLLGGPLDDGRQTMYLVKADDADAVRAASPPILGAGRAARGRLDPDLDPVA